MGNRFQASPSPAGALRPNSPRAAPLCSALPHWLTGTLHTSGLPHSCSPRDGHSCPNTHMHVHKHTHTRTHIHTHAHTYTHTYTPPLIFFVRWTERQSSSLCSCEHTSTHTHTHSPSYSVCETEDIRSGISMDMS